METYIFSNPDGRMSRSTGEMMAEARSRRMREAREAREARAAAKSARVAKVGEKVEALTHAMRKYDIAPCTAARPPAMPARPPIAAVFTRFIDGVTSRFVCPAMFVSKKKGPGTAA